MTLSANFPSALAIVSPIRPKRNSKHAFSPQKAGIEVIPVWNKSNREHTIIGSEPSPTRAAADAAVKALGWTKPYFCDADHINLTTVDRFLAPCDFFTIDVADYIGKPADAASIDAFVKRHPNLLGVIQLDGVERGHRDHTRDLLRSTAAEISLRRPGRPARSTATSKPQRARETSSPRSRWTRPTPRRRPPSCSSFSPPSPTKAFRSRPSRRNSAAASTRASTTSATSRSSRARWRSTWPSSRYAVAQYGLPANLKLSVHSGSDKFSIYPAIHAAMKKFDAGVHLKTAGTTWLEEMIGLAEAGGDGLALAKEIYAEAFAHREELCAPYATVIDIDPASCPHRTR